MWCCPTDCVHFFCVFVDSSRDGSIDTHHTAYYIYRDYNVCRHRKDTRRSLCFAFDETKLIAAYHILELTI